MNRCVLCGRCTNIAYQITGDERLAPRNLVWKKEKGDESMLFFHFPLNGETTCPLGIQIEELVLDMRRRLVSKGKGLRAHKLFLQEFLAGRNPYRLKQSVVNSSTPSQTSR